MPANIEEEKEPTSRSLTGKVGQFHDVFEVRHGTKDGHNLISVYD